ncbi:restriction endonuclease subunit S [Acinetobacter baumannii]|uniref:restriction endonuclease subunit S n=1 Tax=Acinetobacter baumannii TaxID=470 RepID=UPI0009A8FE8A|nr:restriction endonuclease subunit S [Acinetobacter baumannii]AVI39342.1 type I restriction modification DNA specificity domain protein [Acinetobacter baumannii]EHU1628422.1 restriction endonuclease subunit S [Acinetobacter baumannii]EHU2917354.1 restriction endonuclease subunit S [Acinetobacter baumannii]EHU2921468.1 restriction endonuclease subunit S [Acinetobacter baumannii]EHU2925542.1 restriction endonuclease subunit S [Acinetobacter baumannii]
MIAPKLRFKEFDGDWSALKYKDVLTIKYGKDHKSLDEGDIPVYGTGGVMRYVDQYLYEGESILIGRKGTIDQPKYVNEKFWTVDTLFYTEIKKNALPLFLFQHALQVNWLGLNEATGVPSLNTTSINNVDVYLPSNEEQTKIASFLSAVDEKISQLNRKHELLSQYKQGMMQKLFSQQIRFKADDGSEFGEWEYVFLGDISKPQQWKTISSSELTEIGYPVFGANGYIGFYHKYNHINETIVVTCRGATCGEVTLVKAKSYITGNAMSIDEINEKEHSTLYIYYAGVVCGRGRNPTLRLWPAIFSGEIDVFPSERRNMGQEIGR